MPVYISVLFFLLMLCFMIALVCFVERFLRLYFIHKQGKQLKMLLEPHLEEKNWKEACMVCQQSRSLFGRIVQAGLLQHAYGRKRMQEAFESQGAREMAAMERPMHVLCIIAQIAPLIGLLAMLLAATDLFSRALSIEELGQVMQRALMAMAYGLVVAIPSMIGYHLLMLRAERYCLALEQMTGTILDQLTCDEKE